MSYSYSVTPLPYYFKGKELQPTKNNSYTFKEKVEICIKLNQEYKAGILSLENWYGFGKMAVLVNSPLNVLLTICLKKKLLS